MATEGEPFPGTLPPLRPDERCAVCGESLPENVYGVSGMSGLFCSDACLSKAVNHGE